MLYFFGFGRTVKLLFWLGRIYFCFLRSLQPVIFNGFFLLVPVLSFIQYQFMPDGFGLFHNNRISINRRRITKVNMRNRLVILPIVLFGCGLSRFFSLFCWLLFWLGVSMFHLLHHRLKILLLAVSFLFRGRLLYSNVL